MSAASPSPGVRPTVRLPYYAPADRAAADRVPQHLAHHQQAVRHGEAAPYAGAAPHTDPVDYSGLLASSDGNAGVLDGDPAGVHERGGYGGSPHSVAAARDATDLADLSHSDGDGARYAVQIAQARSRAETPAARTAKLRLHMALDRIRQVCARAMRQRMHTEMADLAAQIRKMHDRDAPPR